MRPGILRCVILAFIGFVVPLVLASQDGPPPARDADAPARRESDTGHPKEEAPVRVPALETVRDIEPNENAPLAPIKTKNVIRVNANVSFPQDI